MMAPFENVGELITFISLFFFAVIIVPYAFIKIENWYRFIKIENWYRTNYKVFDKSDIEYRDGDNT